MVNLQEFILFCKILQIHERKLPFQMVMIKGSAAKALCLAAIAALSFGLSGCNGASANLDSVSGKEAANAPNLPIVHLSPLDRLSSVALADDGIFVLENLYADSQNILYIDAKTKQEVFLCSSPGCSHDTEACPSFLPAKGGYGYQIAFYQNHLFVFQNESADGTAPFIMQLEANGESPQTICTLQSGESFSGKIFGYGDSLLVEITKADGNSTSSRLEKIDCATGKQETLFQYPQDGYYSAMTSIENRLIYISIDNGEYQYFAVDPGISGLSLPDCRHNSPIGPVFDNAALSCTIQESYLCCVDYTSQQITAENLLNNQVTRFPWPDGEDFKNILGLNHLLDDRFALMTADDNDDWHTYILDAETGTPNGTDILGTKTQPRELIRCFGDEVLYLSRIETRTLRHQTENGLSGETCYVNIYGFMPAEEYLSGSAGQEVAFPM